MRISQIFQLGKQQPELDFIDVDIDEDIQLFIDPYFIANRNDPWSINVSDTVRGYFQNLIDKLRDDDPEAVKLMSYLHEPNETCLGLSQGKPRGRGVGQHDIAKLYNSLSKSKAVKTGVVSDIEDCHIFVDGFGKDKLSDMTTGIIRKHLIEYTQQQARLNGLPLRQGTQSGYFWDKRIDRWNNEHTDMLVADGRVILLVPKGVVSFTSGYTPDKYYNKFVLEFLQNDFQNLNPILIKRRKSGEKYVTKVDLKEEYPYSKQYLHKFTENHPEIFEDFRLHAKDDYEPTATNDIRPCDITQVTSYLIEQLRSIPVGADDATKYHRLIAGILELIFYPDLMFPEVEQEINQRRKRIDIVFTNTAKEKFFHDLHDIKKIYSPCIMIECKNYTNDPKNAELDQLIGRFSLNRGRFGLLFCRNIEKNELFLERCRDTLKDGHGLIIPFTDDDIIRILEDIGKNTQGSIVNSEMIYLVLEEKSKKIFMG
jgi:hypothetical protein